MFPEESAKRDVKSGGAEKGPGVPGSRPEPGNASYSEISAPRPGAGEADAPKIKASRSGHGADGSKPEDTDRYLADFMKGDPAAVRTVAGWARSVITHRVWEFENTEDIVQATLLALLENLKEGKFKGGNLRAYVRRIAKNKSISSYRKMKTRGVRVQLDESEYLYLTRCGGGEAEKTALVSRILDSLEEKCRAIILLAYVQGYSRREISSALGISEGAARVRLFRCVESARSMFGGLR